MSEAKFREPWAYELIEEDAFQREGTGEWYDSYRVQDVAGRWVAGVTRANLAAPLAPHALRIVACVNAFAGIDDPAAFMAEVADLDAVFECDHAIARAVEKLLVQLPDCTAGEQS